MGDDELSELRRRRLEQLQRRQVDDRAVEEEMQRHKEVESRIQLILKQILDPEARERLNRIKLTRPDFAKAVEQQLVALAQSGRLQERISDAQLVALLKQLVPEKKDFNITRK